MRRGRRTVSAGGIAALLIASAAGASRLAAQSACGAGLDDSLRVALPSLPRFPGGAEEAAAQGSYGAREIPGPVSGTADQVSVSWGRRRFAPCLPEASLAAEFASRAPSCGTEGVSQPFGPHSCLGVRGSISGTATDPYFFFGQAAGVVVAPCGALDFQVFYVLRVSEADRPAVARHSAELAEFVRAGATQVGQAVATTLGAAMLRACGGPAAPPAPIACDTVRSRYLEAVAVQDAIRRSLDRAQLRFDQAASRRDRALRGVAGLFESSPVFSADLAAGEGDLSAAGAAWPEFQNAGAELQRLQGHAGQAAIAGQDVLARAAALRCPLEGLPALDSTGTGTVSLEAGPRILSGAGNESVFRLRSVSGSSAPAAQGTLLAPGDTLDGTIPASAGWGGPALSVALASGVLSLRPGSRMTVERDGFRLEAGELWVAFRGDSSGQLARLRILTPAAAAEAPGTIFAVGYEPETGRTGVRVATGAVDVAPAISAPAVRVERGMQVEVTLGGMGPVEPLGVRALGQATAGLPLVGAPREGVDLAGSLLRAFPPDSAGSRSCDLACARDPACKGYTYLRPPADSAGAAVCYLKAEVTGELPNDRAVSAVAQLRRTAGPVPVLIPPAPALPGELPAPDSAPRLPVPPSRCTGFTGTWSTNLGDLTLTADGDQVRGSQPGARATVRGAVVGNVLRGLRTAPGLSEAPFQLTLLDGGRRLEGILELAPGNTVTWRGTCAIR